MRRCLAALSVAAALLVSYQAEGSPSSYSEALSQIEFDLQRVSNEFDSRGGAMRKATLDERLEDGIVLQAAGDHQRASYIFMDIVSHSEWRGKPGYQAAQLQLARSLYENGYYRLSQRHLIDLLQTGVGSERREGVMLLLQVAQHTGDWAEVNMALSSAQNVAETSAYLYLMARAMFLQEAYDSARDSLSRQTGEDEWTVKGEYLKGVLDIKAQDLDSASQHFARVADSTLKFRGSSEVHDLAVLAQARIAYDRQDWNTANDYYQQISENSPYFPAVLYEMGWTHIQREQYVAAQQKFELLLLSYPEDSHALETRRIIANLKRELRKYDEATASYQQIVNEFEPIMTEMESEAGDSAKRKADMKRRIEAEQYDTVQIVPKSAKGVVAVGSDVNRVETMLDSLSESDANTIASENIMAEINALLQSDTNIKNLPEFQNFTQRSRDYRVSALLTGYDFTQEYEDVSELDTLVDEVGKLPRTTQEREILAALESSEREEREARFHRLMLQSDSLRHRTKILRSWLDSGKASSLSEEERTNLLSELDSFEDELQRLKGFQEEVDSKIISMRSAQSLGHGADGDVTSLISELGNRLDDRWSRSIASGKATGEYRELIEQERRLLSQLDGFDARIQVSLDERAREFRSRLDREAQNVSSEKARFVAMKSEVGDAAGEISARYWQTVYDQIRDMVLNADLGMVDIAWLKKDERSKALAQAMEERKKEREVLEQDFRQFLKESGQE